MNKRKIVCTTLCAIAFTFNNFQVVLADPSSTGQNPLIPRSVLFGNPDKISPIISPDGKYLAYLSSDKNGVQNVFVRTIGKNDDKAVTKDKLRGIWSAFWQGDSSHIIYKQDVGGDENFHLYQTDIKSGTTRDLTPFFDVRAEVVAKEPDIPDKILVEMNVRNAKYMDVYSLDLNSGALNLVAKNPGDVQGWSADSKLQVRLAQAVLKGAKQELRVRDSVNTPWRTILKWGPEESTQVVSFSKDGKSLFISTDVGSETSRLASMNLATGKMTDIAQDKQFDHSGTLINAKEHKIQAAAFYKERLEWKAIDPKIQADLDAIKKIQTGDFSIRSKTYDDKKWIVLFDNDTSPSNYYLYDRVTGKSNFLFSDKPELKKYNLAKMKAISFTASDDMKIYAYLTLPPNVEAKNLPMVMVVHGGPWSRDIWGNSSTPQWLANRGYAVLQVNYRGSTGYGKKYLNAGNQEWSKKMHTDLLDAKKWAIEKGYADPNKVAIYGGSYGGYAALVGATFTPDEFCCAVDLVGPSNLVTLLKTIPPYWESVKQLFFVRLGDPDKDKTFLESCSPLFKVDSIKIPMLIAQGLNDPRVKVAESDQIVSAMRKNGKPVDYMICPDEGHGFVRPENRLKFYARMESFLAKNLGGRVETVSSREASDDLMK